MSASVSTYETAPVALAPLFGNDGLFAIDDVTGEGIASFETEERGYLRLLGTETNLPDLNITFRNSGVVGTFIFEQDEAFNSLAREWNHPDDLVAFLRVSDGVHTGDYCITYDNNFTPEKMLRILSVTGDQIYGTAKGYGWDANVNQCDVITVYTDSEESLPLTLRTPQGVSVSLSEESGALQYGTDYKQTAILTYGEATKTVYIHYEYQDASGSNDMSGLFAISDIADENKDVDGWEVSGSYNYIYYDVDGGVNIPAELNITFSDGKTCSATVDTSGDATSPKMTTLTRGIWSRTHYVYYWNSLAALELTVDGVRSNASGGGPDTLLAFTDRWDEYPTIAVKKLQGG